MSVLLFTLMIGKAAFSIQCQCSEPMQEVVVGCSETENNGVKVLVVDQLTSHYQTVTISTRTKCFCCLTSITLYWPLPQSFP